MIVLAIVSDLVIVFEDTIRVSQFLEMYFETQVEMIYSIMNCIYCLCPI